MENIHACDLLAVNLTKLASPQSETVLNVKSKRLTMESWQDYISSLLAFALVKYLSTVVLSSAYAKVLGINISLTCTRRRVADSFRTVRNSGHLLPHVRKYTYYSDCPFTREILAKLQIAKSRQKELACFDGLRGRLCRGIKNVQ